MSSSWISRALPATVRSAVGKLLLLSIFYRYVAPASGVKAPRRFDLFDEGLTNWRKVDEPYSSTGQFEMSWYSPEAVKSTSERARALTHGWKVIDARRRGPMQRAVLHVLSAAPYFRNKARTEQEISETVYVMY